jgi:uncharacterized surface protein with fasciclin (FAS1) repeats
MQKGQAGYLFMNTKNKGVGKMKSLHEYGIAGLVLMLAVSCGQPSTQSAGADTAVDLKGQSAVVDKDSKPDVVKIAVGSKDHTKLVAALQAAEYVDVLSNVGPFTVFAPTNDAFAKLPAGTVETLVKKENLDKLRTILEYHVYVGSLRRNLLSDGMNLGQASGHNAVIVEKEGELYINDAKILGSVEASNGIVYVIDKVLLPPSK